MPIFADFVHLFFEHASVIGSIFVRFILFLASTSVPDTSNFRCSEPLFAEHFSNSPFSSSISMRRWNIWTWLNHSTLVKLIFNHTFVGLNDFKWVCLKIGYPKSTSESSFWNKKQFGGYAGDSPFVDTRESISSWLYVTLSHYISSFLAYDCQFTSILVG